MTVIDHPWLFRDDDGMPRFRGTAWYGGGQRAASPRGPGPLPKKEAEAHDESTRRLMRMYDDMYQLQESETVVPLLEEWKWRDSMQTAAEKQAYLEPLIARAKKAPEKYRGEFVFLLLVFEGIRRGVERRLLNVRGGLDGPAAAPSAYRREEARRVAEIEHGRLVDVTRQAVFEAIYRFPATPPPNLFGWLRETVAHFTLDFLHDELAELETTSTRGEQAVALQAFLGGFGELKPPALGEQGGFRKWHFGVRWLYDPVGQYLNHHEVRSVCRTAVDRLPRRQREVIDGEFYGKETPDELASKSDVARSTIYNLKAQALAKLKADDCFFLALCGLELVRDSERAAQLKEKFPGGRLKDGRRIVHIDVAA